MSTEKFCVREFEQSLEKLDAQGITLGASVMRRIETLGLDTRKKKIFLEHLCLQGQDIRILSELCEQHRQLIEKLLQKPWREIPSYGLYIAPKDEEDQDDKSRIDLTEGLPCFTGQKFYRTTSQKRMTQDYYQFVLETLCSCSSRDQQIAFLKRENISEKSVTTLLRKASKRAV